MKPGKAFRSPVPAAEKPLYGTCIEEKVFAAGRRAGTPPDRIRHKEKGGTFQHRLLIYS